MNLIVTIPDAYLPEQKYIIRTIFEYFWGFEITIGTHQKNNVVIKHGSTAGCLKVKSHFFLTPEREWLTPASLPTQPLKKGAVQTRGFEPTLVKEEVPVIYGNVFKDNALVSKKEQAFEISIDIFGSAFFMLTRYEEVVSKEKDRYNRFPVSASLAMQESFLERPIINEYLEILWACMAYLWPQLQRRPRKFSMVLSHDVDEPFKYALQNSSKIIKRIIKKGLKFNFSGAQRISKEWNTFRKYGYKADPFNTFDAIMDISEENNCKSAFYFISGHTSKKDGIYNIGQPQIQKILSRVFKRGHEIGLHPSFNSYDDGRQISLEFKKLKKQCEQLDIHQDVWGGRQHYLRWKTPETFQHWEQAGLNYDSTLTYAEDPGFRCGICYSYPVFNVKKRKSLKLIEKPLIVMEVSVLDNRYLGLSDNLEEALQLMTSLKSCCKMFEGEFTLLWHNSRFSNQKDFELYKQILKQ